MIELGYGDLLAAEVDALVNAVNCAGVMGKGIALDFKRQFPENYRAYRVACGRSEVQPGRMFVVELTSSVPKYVINFQTNNTGARVRGWWTSKQVCTIWHESSASWASIRSRCLRSVPAMAG